MRFVRTCLGRVVLVIAGMVSVAFLVAVLVPVFTDVAGVARNLVSTALGPIASSRMTTEAPARSCWYHRIAYRRERSPIAMVLHVFEFDPDRITIGLAGGDGRTRAVTELVGKHTLAINACYFDEHGRPVMMARHGKTVIHRRVGGTSAFFWQRRDGRVGITHASRFRDGPQYSLVVQSVPRLMADGQPTRGLRDTETLALRSGVGILPNGHVIFYSTGSETYAHGVSYSELRTLLGDHLDVESLLSLDGGASVQFAFAAGGTKVVDVGGREVPVFLTVDLRE